MRSNLAAVTLFSGILGAFSAPSPSLAKDSPIPIKVVIVTMFEAGADTGDRPGELQYWVERNHLDTVLPFPQAYHALRMNRDGVLAVLTGVGTAKAAGSIMALGLDPRFDLRKAYWIVAGIAGVDPLDASLGSAAWAEWVVDGDLGYEIDGREIPADWPTGFVPLGKSKPYEPPRAEGWGEAYHLNAALADWAFHLTERVDLGDTPAMEDTGTLCSLQMLAKANRVDWNRIMVLRTASDFDQPPPGVSAAENLARNAGRQYAGYLPALESAWRVGNTVVQEITTHWSKYK
jgi:purine nucleoside permease